MEPYRLVSRSDVALYAVSTNAPAVVAVLAGLVVRHVLGPADFGVYFLLLAIGRYFALVHSPLNAVVDIEVPLLQRSDPRFAERIIRSAHRWLVRSSLVEALLLFGGALLFLPQSESNVLVSAAVSMALPLDAIAQQQRLVLKVQGRFRPLATRSAMAAAVEAALDIGATIAFGVPGFVGAVVAGAVIRVLVLTGGIRRPSLNVFSSCAPVREPLQPVLRRVLGSVTLYKLSQTTSETVDRVIVGLALGTEQLGIYSLSVAVVGLVRLIPRAVSGAVLPALLRSERARSERALVESHSLVCALAAAVGAGAVCALELVPHVLPAYEAAIVPGKILVVAEIVQQSRLALSGGVLGTTNRRPLAISSILGVVAATTLALAAAQMSGSLTAVAASSIIAYLLALAVVLWAVPPVVRRSARLWMPVAASSVAVIAALSSESTTMPLALALTVGLMYSAVRRLVNTKNSELFGG